MKSLLVCLLVRLLDYLQVYLRQPRLVSLALYHRPRQHQCPLLSLGMAAKAKGFGLTPPSTDMRCDPDRPMSEG